MIAAAILAALVKIEVFFFADDDAITASLAAFFKYRYWGHILPSLIDDLLL